MDVKLPNGITFATTGFPWVSVPVLSNAIVLTSASRSRAEPVRTIMPCFADRLMPLIIAIGAARMSGHGVATTITSKKRIGSPLTSEVLVLPVAGVYRVICMVYGDNGASARPIDHLELLEIAAGQAGIIFENTSLRKHALRQVS